MKQLTQKLKTGKMQILEVSIPAMRKGQVLVQNFYSIISAGTEGSTVKAARKGYIGKAKERPQQVKQVIDTLMSQVKKGLPLTLSPQISQINGRKAQRL